MSLERYSLPELKARLKAVGLTGAGDKTDLIKRLTLYDMGETHKVDGQNPAQMKVAALRKAVAARGLSCIGSQDEMLQLLLDHLKGEAGPSKARPSGPSNPAAEAEAQALRLMNRVLHLSEEANHEGVLSLMGEPITRSSTVGAMRKAYLKLSLLLHPDKLGPKVENATKAFQAVVAAFETLSRPEAPPDPGTGKPRGPTISRSNEGCFVTKIACPRCRVDWGAKVEGNPDYFYTFMMMGLRTFTCATCLLQFGCMAASHRCPHCGGCIEYHPNDYHRQVQCPHPRCAKPFGFWLHHVPERVLTEVRQQVKLEQEQRLRAEEARRRRGAAAGRRASAADGVDEEQLFILGLKDSCPRCGETLEGLPDEEAQRQHLQACLDPARHAHHAKRRAAEGALAQQREQQQALQDAVAAEAAWTLLGAQSQHLWLLSEPQLRDLCAQASLPTEGNREDLIARLAAHKKDQRFIAADEEGGVLPEATGDTLPSNLHAMSEAQLRAVCAAHNIDPKPLRSKKALLRALEAAQFAPLLGGTGPAVPLLTQPPAKLRVQNRRAPKRSPRPDSDSDAEPRPDGRRRGNPKPRRAVVGDDDDDDDDADFAPTEGLD